jgi:hypothetical protein
LAKEVAARHPAIVITDTGSAVTISAGAAAWDTLRRFSQDLLTAALESQ